MKVELTWTDPAVSASQAPLAYLKVAMGVAGSPDFTEVARIAPGAQYFAQTDLPAGDYVFAVSAVDVQVPPREGAAATIAVTVAAAAPGAVTNLQASVTEG